MENGNNAPDAPFRSGVNGKYKLLIKSVTSTPVNYEYELVDADGNLYKAGHPKHFTEDEILRCMVYFKIENAKLVVTDTLICNKQDYAIPLTEEPRSVSKPKSGNPSKTKRYSNQEIGDPIHGRVSGVYNLRVAEVKRGDKKCSYVLEDAMGRKYKAQSPKYYAEGRIVGCQVKTLITGGGYKATVTKVGTKPHYKKHGRRGGLQTREWMDGPSVGDHFRLIYTPMGNKR